MGVAKDQAMADHYKQLCKERGFDFYVWEIFPNWN
jgi:hypothetical protein